MTLSQMKKEIPRGIYAEAVVIFNKTGLTPRQLSDALENEKKLSFRTSATLLQEKVSSLTYQRNELLEALKVIAENAEEPAAIETAQNAITKAQQEGL